MHRRLFLTTMGAGMAGASLAGAQEQTAKIPRYFEFISYRMTQGARPGRLAETFKKALPLVDKHKVGPVGLFNVTLGPESPTTIELIPWNSLTEREEIQMKLMADPEFLKLAMELESGSEPPVDGVDSSLVRTTPYSPELAAAADGQKPRLFELRVYHSPTHRQLMALHQRFGGPEIKIFHRCGIHPILYGETAIGRNMPNLVYMTPFESLAAREKAWAAFGADEEWQKVRAESIQKSGNIVSNVSITMLQAAPFSPIR